MSTTLLGLPLPLPVSLTQTGDRSEKMGTAEIFFFRRGAHCAPISLPLRNARFRTATHAASSPQARHKVNCPKGKRRPPWGYPCRATRWSRIFCTALANFTNYIAGRDDLIPPYSYTLTALHYLRLAARYPIAFSPLSTLHSSFFLKTPNTSKYLFAFAR